MTHKQWFRQKKYIVKGTVIGSFFVYRMQMKHIVEPLFVCPLALKAAVLPAIK